MSDRTHFPPAAAGRRAALLLRCLLRVQPGALLRVLPALLLPALLLASAGSAHANEKESEKENCFHTASVKYQLDPWLLVAIARVESTMQPDAHRKYEDGSEDIGLMQINSVWLPELARHGIVRADLFNHCTSIHVGAWILATQLYRHGKSWYTVGRYHSTTPAKNAAWVARVVSRLRSEHPNFALFSQALTPAAAKVATPSPSPASASSTSTAPVSQAPAAMPNPA